MNKDSEKSLSIIIPCFNETQGLAQLVSKLADLQSGLECSSELVFVDDGSSDSTHERLMELYKNGIGKDVKVVRHPVNRGVGGALKTGINNSGGDYIAAIDSDCTYEPSFLIEMFEIMKDRRADMITASPYHPEGATTNVPGYRLFLSRNLSRIYSLVLKSTFHTYTSMFRIYRRAAIRSIDFESEGFLAMAEILIKMHQIGFKIVEYPATLTKRRFGTSSAKTLKIIKEHLFFISSMLIKRKEKYETANRH